jgi:PAS domain S-box-containing protein
VKKFHLDVGIRIPLLYLIFGGLWILFSDELLESLVHNTEDLTRFQSYKGWAYVTASALLIYFLLRQYLRLQKKTAAQLHESEERLRLAVTAANQGIFDLNVATGQIIVNDIFPLLLGYDPRLFTENISSYMERMHPDDRSTIEQAFDDYVNGKVDEYKVEFRQRTSTGEWKWISSIGQIVERDTSGQPARLLGTFTDITDRKNAEIIRNQLFDDSQRRLKRISSLREIDEEISSSSELSSTLDKIVNNLLVHLEADAVDVLLLDENENTFYYADSIGFDTERIKNARVKFGGSFAGIAAETRGVVHFSDLENEDVDEAFRSLLKEESIKSYYGVALVAKEKIVGVLELYLRKDFEPDNEWLDFFQTLAGQAALAIENAQLVAGMESTNKELSQVNSDLILANANLMSAYDATIESLTRALNLRDYETEDHSRRVSIMMLELSDLMGFSPEERIHINRGTLLHDIGKMGVPDAILRKPGLLTPDERKIMEQHPVFAYDLLKSIDYLKPALSIPHLHHEKWDGTGYPHGLKGEDIPLSARLFALVDVFDALTSDRPYRKAWSIEKTCEYILEQSGKHFDPNIVNVFMEYIKNKKDLI